MFEKMPEAYLNKYSMANVSTTPNRKTAFGESDLTAEALKKRFDRLPRYIANKLNEVLEGLPSGDLADYIYVKVDGKAPQNLAVFINKLQTGDVGDIKVETPSGMGSLNFVCDLVFQMDNGLYTGDLAERLILASGVSLKKFYDSLVGKDFLEESELPVAIREALTQAKESGEFDGKDGADGLDGKDGKDGANGKDGKDGTDGKTPYILNGYWYIDGTNTGVKAQGEKGDKGDPYTLTVADKAAIVNAVIAALPVYNGEVEDV